MTKTELQSTIPLVPFKAQTFYGGSNYASRVYDMEKRVWVSAQCCDCKVTFHFKVRESEAKKIREKIEISQWRCNRCESFFEGNYARSEVKIPSNLLKKHK